MDTQANHSLEVSLLFPKNSQASDFLPITLNVSACAPIRINPNHWQLVSTDLHKLKALSRNPDNKLSFTFSIDFDTTHPLMSIPPPDSAIRLVTSYVTGSTDSSKMTQFIETSVRIPLSWIFSGSICRKRDMAGLFKLNFVLSHAYIPKMGLQIIWSAQLPECPVRMAMPPITVESTGESLPRIGRNTPPGLIALLTASGKLSLSYLGTNPDAAIVRVPVKAAQLDSNGKEEQQKLHNELLELQLKIETLSEKGLLIPRIKLWRLASSRASKPFNGTGTFSRIRFNTSR
ncbi:hypothetical protein AHF37_02871 [Paragonimus kellicotti]|nr:hypothetical protein AHF37_02871 [Paragonimus kellicotti]